MKIFPDFEIEQIPAIEDGIDGFNIHIQTQVRKKVNKKWYKVCVRSKYWVSSNTLLAIENVIKDFNNTCYRTQLSDLNKRVADAIDCNFIYFELDTDQRSEEDRLNNVSRYNKIKFI